MQLEIRGGLQYCCLERRILYWSRQRPEFCRKVSTAYSVDIYIYIYIYIYTAIYIYTHIHTYIHAYMHTYIHTDRQTDRQIDIISSACNRYRQTNDAVKTFFLVCFLRCLQHFATTVLKIFIPLLHVLRNLHFKLLTLCTHHAHAQARTLHSIHCTA